GGDVPPPGPGSAGGATAGRLTGGGPPVFTPSGHRLDGHETPAATTGRLPDHSTPTWAPTRPPGSPARNARTSRPDRPSNTFTSGPPPVPGAVITSATWSPSRSATATRTPPRKSAS